MKDFLIIGVDVSKSTLDIFIKPTGVALQICNDLSGFKDWMRQLKKQCPSDVNVLIVMEHTGQYSYRFENFLRSHGIGYCKVAALEIKRSLGVTRGKNDKVDAERIANYGWLRRDILVPDPETSKEITSLRSLLSLRDKLVRDRSSYMIRLKEMKAAGTGGSFEIRIQQKTIDHYSKLIKAIEKEITKLISSNAELSATCELLRSIKGVGWIIAAYMISCTANFTRFTNARKFNCYAGLAPFKYESGTSLRGRARVSHLANKQAKTLLNLAASSAIRCDQELKDYYRKRVSEGKRKMSCLNIIRSKIVARMFAVVKRQSPYQPCQIAA